MVTDNSSDWVSHQHLENQLPQPLPHNILRSERGHIDRTLTFCNVQHQQLYDMVVHQRHFAQEKSDQGTGAPPLLDNQPTTEQERLLFQVQEMGQHRKPEPERTYQDTSIHPPGAETYIPLSNVLNYQLSTCPPGKGGWTVTPCPKTEEDQDTEKKEEVMPFHDHEPFHFGISRHQEGSGLLQKYYFNGKKFLTVFPDGSAQVFYPSGLLALVVLVAKGKGRVCIVYDDDHAPKQPIRALFQSNGRATCYHSNGNIWLILDRLGGQCLDEAGTRIRRWTWSSPGPTPIPLRPVFLALNRSLGVRVLGQERVFVSFLACGQQARFSVGICCVQVEHKGDRPVPGPSITKEELFLLAGRIGVHLAIRHLHQCLQTPSNLRPSRARLTPHLLSVVRRLLFNSDTVQMRDRERAFIHRCLQDCL